jgi:divalent metal cation (Fe/Co/Zn/Cd) transporter
MSITAITLLILTIIFKEILGRISRYYGEKIYSTALEADSWHHRTDAISSVLVIIAILSSQAGFDILDGIIGIVIGLFVIYTGIDIVRRTSIKLLGTKASDELLKQVESLVLINENALAIHDMICHEYGSQLVISFHLEVPSELKLSEAHTIADKIEKRIFNELNIQATVHLDPVLPVLFNKNEIKSVIDSVLSAEETIYQYSELRLIGEESHATLVLDMESRDDITVEKMEYLNNRLKQEILRRIPKLKDVKINFTP